MGSWTRWSATLAAFLWIAPLGASANGPPLEPARNQACAKKRTDACGCHHYYGLRHCHPKLKTERCERPVSFTGARPHAKVVTPAVQVAPSKRPTKKEAKRQKSEASPDARPNVRATHEAL